MTRGKKTRAAKGLRKFEGSAKTVGWESKVVDMTVSEKNGRRPEKNQTKKIGPLHFDGDVTRPWK